MRIKILTDNWTFRPATVLVSLYRVPVFASQSVSLCHVAYLSGAYRTSVEDQSGQPASCSSSSCDERQANGYVAPRRGFHYGLTQLLLIFLNSSSRPQM